MKQFLSRLCMVSGFVCIIWGSFLVVQRNDRRFTADDNSIQLRSKFRIVPQQLLISSIGVNLPIIGAKISGGKWDETTAGVSYITKSPAPGEVGNSILYGHNWSTLLGDLPKIKTGDKITVRYQNIPDRIFTVQFINTVSPDETYVLMPSKDRRITLYTCTGPFDSKRLVVTAILDSGLLSSTLK